MIIINNSHLFFTAAEFQKIVAYVSDRVDDQIDRLEIANVKGGEVIVIAQDGQRVFPLSEIFPK